MARLLPRRTPTAPPPSPDALPNRRPPLALAITGGIGAGKSAALESFRAHGAATVSSDEIVHNLLASDRGVKDALVERFGEQIIGDDRRPDRAKIGKIVFGDRQALDWLEQLLHPLASREYLVWREQLAQLPNPPAVCVTEVPLLYEVGSEGNFDRVAVVTAPRQLREQRRRVPLDNRDARLLTDQEKIARADYHYVNTGTFEDLDAWVEMLMEELTAERR